MNGANALGTYVWVRTDLVEAIVDHGGQLPSNYKPRKRARATDADWGWCRAQVMNSTSVTASSPTKRPDNCITSPFGTVKLRKTNSPEAKWGSPDRLASQTLHVTLRVDDNEFAPLHLQGTTVDFTYKTDDFSKVCAANVWWLQEDGVPPSDLTELEQLHEPSVVYCLLRRYQFDHIYTYTGKILLALNPFRALDSVYGESVMQQYWQGNFENRPPPHIYAIAEDAYRSMMRSMQTPRKQDQSILVSGESGAGKTVTTKIIMRYLATLSQRSEQRASDHTSIESQVLQSNPILESFGNARTVRNDNSSRFGKFIEIQFDNSGCLASASIETYLLEKVRLISQAPGERNYHIFYELLAGLPQKERRELCIGNVTARDFRMTAMSGTFDRRDGVEDKDTYRELRAALDTVGFTREEQQNLFTVACALLHTSNLTFREAAVDASELDTSNRSLRPAVSLLGVEAGVLNEALCRCAIEARGETLYKNMSVQQAEKAIEALIKVTYGALFNFIVSRINDSIDMRRGHADAGKMASIGVLDIFGFESFEVNSFEQLCINYCNEALQQQFNRFVFKLEQQEYEKEGIEWSFISFPDNQDVLDLIEKKHEGILSVLDEQCRLPRCTDATFARAVYDKCSGHPRFEATMAQQADLTFSVQHYAGLVEYATDNFLEKNKDELPKEAILLLSSSANPFLAMLGGKLGDTQAQSLARKSTGANRRQLQRASSSILHDGLGIQFQAQLKILRTRIEATEPHYVRCLKPNDELIPHSFDALVIADQLRCAGVLEAIRVSRVGFPHRYKHDHFVERYSLLARLTLRKHSRHSNGSELCEILVDILAPELAQLLESGAKSGHVATPRGKGGNYLGMQMGRTKVFLRRKAFEGLEYLRNQKLDQAAAKIQAAVRMYLARFNFEVAVYAAVVIQNFVRCVGAYRLAQEQRYERASMAIQRAWRCYIARQVLRMMLREIRYDQCIIVVQCAWRCAKARRLLYAAQCIAWWCQSTYRGAIARQYCAYLFLDQKASVIQHAWAQHVRKRTFTMLRKSVVRLQGRYRIGVAKKELYKLRREARDLTAVAAERDQFRKELQTLRKELDEAKRSPSVVSAPAAPPARSQSNEELRRLREEVRRLQMELEKAHRMSSATAAQQENIRLLGQELAHREEHLEMLKREVVSLRSMNDSFSVKSLTIESPMGFAKQPKFDSPMAKIRGSPVRSDVSLLDEEEGADGPLHPKPKSPIFRDRINKNPPVPPNILEQPEDLLPQLHGAIRQGNRLDFDRVLKQSSEICLLINQGDKYGRTALHLASLALRADMVEILISRGAVVNAQDDDGETPLHLAESISVMELLLKKGRANPNIPNVDGICALHLAVQRRDVDCVRALLRSGANVNNADNIRWFTPLHLVALPARHASDENHATETRARVAQLLCGSFGAQHAEIDYQDSEGNSPLHYASQLEKVDAFSLVEIFLEKGANPNITNERQQSPLHLLCHNSVLRLTSVFHDTLHSMLYQGADPNLQSLTGCTPLHLSLYHKDIESAVQLVYCGAELHLSWKKPKRWAAFWNDRGMSNVLALDMVEDETDLHRILSAITKPSKWAPARTWCMQCQSALGTFARAMHCRHCSRLICGSCASCCLPPHYFPKSFKVQEPSWVCCLCEKILLGRKDDNSHGTPPTATSYGDDVRGSSYGDEVEPLSSYEAVTSSEGEGELFSC